MEKYNGLPIYIIDFNEQSEWNNISLVDFPAIKTDFIRLSQIGDVQLSINEDKKEISGPVLIPDQLILRKDENGSPYYIKFKSDVIKKMALEFFKRDKQNNGNVMHQFDVEDITFFESYLLNKERGITPIEFKDLPDGTWIVTAKVENPDVWNLIKSGDIKGFSIDCRVMYNESKPETLKEIDSLDEFFEIINNKN